MPESIKVSAIIPAKREKIYNAWLNSNEHSAFTGGGKVDIIPRKGGKYSAWDGYISGKTIEMDPYKKIIQTWRTTEFSEDDPDSILEVTFEDQKDKTKITLKHTNIPDGQGDGYKKGWIDFYFKPMKEYFGGKI